MEKAYKILEFDKVLEYLSEHAVSELGKERCLSAGVFDDIYKIKHEITLTTQARRVYDLGFGLPILDIKDISDSLDALKSKVTLATEEIYNVADILRTSRLTNKFLSKFEEEFPELSSQSESLYINKELEDKVFDIFDSALNIKESASKELKNLYNSLRDTNKNIKNKISSLLSNSTFSSYLRDSVYTQRDGRTVFPVKAECKNKIQGIVHDVSASNQTYFIEPKELSELHNKVRELEVLIEAEIKRILRALSTEIGEFYNEIFMSFKQLIEIDFIFAKAKYSAKIEAAPCEISDDKKILIKSMKNPILMRVKKDITENDFYIEKEKNCLIITGSNTGGKTVAIKTVGLFIIMARAGLHIPCQSAEIYPFKKVFADIGDEQSIIQSLSTFSSHMNNIVKIVNEADAESLVILDEIAAGTDPAEGSSLAQAILEYLQKKGAFVVVTTHYGELKSLAYLKEGFKNASVEFDVATLSPTYKLLIGIPGSSNAISIAKNLGIKEEIINIARKMHHEEKDNTAKVLEELQTTHHKLSETKKSVEESKENLKSLEDKLQGKIQDINKNKKKNIDVYKKKYETAIYNAREEIRDILKEIRKEKSEKIARRSFARLAGIETALRKDFQGDEESLANKYIPIDWDNIKIGDKVLIKDLNQEAELLSLPDKGKNVQIQMGLIKTSIKQNKLVTYDKKYVKPLPKKYGLSKSSVKLSRFDLSQTLDLRGYRCEEALDELETYLDKASLANLTPVYVIHGHGTGALKQVIRDYLSDSPYVAKYRPGEQAEGGDGVSVIDIN